MLKSQYIECDINNEINTVELIDHLVAEMVSFAIEYMCINSIPDSFRNKDFKNQR